MSWFSNSNEFKTIWRHIGELENKTKELDYLIKLIGENYQETCERLQRLENAIPVFMLGAQFTPCAEANNWDKEDNIIWTDTMPDHEPDQNLNHTGTGETGEYMSVIGQAIENFLENHPKWKQMEETILQLGTKVQELEKRITQDAKSVIPQVGIDAINAAAIAVESAFPQLTTITEEAKAWGDNLWESHCDEWAKVPAPDKWIIDMWNAHRAGKTPTTATL